MTVLLLWAVSLCKIHLTIMVKIILQKAMPDGYPLIYLMEMQKP